MCGIQDQLFYCGSTRGATEWQTGLKEKNSDISMTSFLRQVPNELFADVESDSSGDDICVMQKSKVKKF